jgi:hypothetical protein
VEVAAFAVPQAFGSKIQEPRYGTPGNARNREKSTKSILAPAFLASNFLRAVGCPSHGRRYYRCLGRDRLKDNTCCTGLIQAEKIETFLWTIIRRALTDTGLLRTKLQELHQSAHHERAALEDRLQQLERAQQATRAKESKLLDGYLELAISREAFTQKHSEILATLRSIDSGLVDVRRRLSGIDTSHVDRTIQSLKTATENLGRLNDDAKQRFLRALIDRITLTGRDVEILGILPAPPTVANRAHHAPNLDTRR